MSTAKILTLEKEQIPTLIREGAIVLFSSLLIGLFGQIAIPLPFTPVPLATQSALVLFLAVLLGPRRAAAAVLLFFVQGACGLPVFAGGVAGGILKFFGPTGGYLIGYLAAAFAAGMIIEKSKEKTLARAAIAFFIGTLTIYLFGVSYLSTFLGVKKALLLGFVPFVVGDLLKIFACLKLLDWIGWNKT